MDTPQVTTIVVIDRNSDGTLTATVDGGQVSTSDRTSFDSLDHLFEVVSDVVGCKLYGDD